MWEIALRNRLNSFLIWKYNAKWPSDQRVLRTLARPEGKRLAEAIERQTRQRGSAGVSTDAIVADLSAGFWVSLLAKSYDVPFAWRYNLPKIFPNEPRLDRANAITMAGHLLDLRNRVAHHEPIYHLPLAERRADLDRLLAGMCQPSHLYVSGVCTVAAVLRAAP